MMTAQTILEKAVGDLETRMGVKRGEILPGEYFALSMACAKCASPFEDVDAAAAGWPLRLADDVYLWPLTIGAMMWLDRARKWYASDADGRRFADALAFASLNSRRPGVFVALDSREKAERAVRDALERCPVTSAEMDAALERVLDNPRAGRDNEPQQRTAFSWAALCAKLEARTGIPARDWIWEKSGGYVLKCYAALEEFAFAAALQAGSKAVYTRMKDELDDAMENLQRVKVAIMRRVRAAREGADDAQG